jgi:hypothetical protein
MSEPRLPGLAPRLRELMAVEEPEDSADEKQDDLIERPRNGQKSKRTTPADRSGYTTVAENEPYGSNRPGEEAACSSHALSLGRRSSWSHSAKGKSGAA